MIPIVSFPFGPWEPDKDGIDLGVCTEALNVFPKGGPGTVWYGPLPALKADPALAAVLPGHPSPIRGLYIARRSDGSVRIFTATTEKFYQRSGAGGAGPSGWADVTGALTPDIPDSHYWQFVQFGDKVYVSSYASGLYSFDMEAGTAFAEVLDAPKVKYLAIFGPFLVGAFDQNASDKNEAFKFWNSGIEHADFWTVGDELCDSQIFKDGGQITGLVAATANDGFVIQETKIRRAVFQPGSDIAFRFETVEERKGAAPGFSTVGVGGTLFFRSEDGFYSFGAQGLQAIGAQRINKWFQDMAEPTRVDRTLGFVDSFSPRVGWAFYTRGSGLLYPDHVLYYDWQLDRWTHSDQVAHVWSSAATEVILDEVTTVPALAAMSDSRQLCFQEGRSRQAVLTTSKAHLAPGGRGFVAGVRAIGDFRDDTLTAQLGKAERTSGDVNWSIHMAPSASTGWVPFRSSGRVHQASVTITDIGVVGPGATWKHCQGIEARVTGDGQR